MSVNSFKAYLTGFTIGSVFATAFTLLYAPRSGEKTRHLLRSRGEEAQAKTRQFLQDTRQRANEALTQKTTQALEEAASLLDHGQEYLDSTRQKVEEEELIA